MKQQDKKEGKKESFCGSKIERGKGLENKREGNYVCVVGQTRLKRKKRMCMCGRIGRA